VGKGIVKLLISGSLG